MIQKRDARKGAKTQSNQWCCLKTAAAMIVLVIGLESMNFPLENGGATIDRAAEWMSK